MNKLNIKGWPTAQTVCEICGGDIIYFQHRTVGGKKILRKQAPKAHAGACDELRKIRNARMKVKRYSKQRSE